MSENLPLQLYFDSSVVAVPGETGAFRWGVQNCSDQPIRELRITLTCDNREAIAAEVGILPQGLSIPPGVCQPVVQYLKVVDGVHKLPIGIQVSGCLADGRSFSLVSLQPPIFTFGDPRKNERKIKIEIEQEGLIKNLGRHYDEIDLKVCGQAIVDLGRLVPAGGEKPLGNLVGQPFHLALDCLIPVPLARQEGPGLSPLDLEQFVASWPGHRHLHLHFVDEHRHPRGQAARVGDICSLHLVASAGGGGYLTLLYRGTSGRYYLFAPNSSVGQESFFIHAGGSSFLPGELLHLPLPAWSEKDILTFNDPGLELALALLTPQSLVNPPVAFDFSEYPQQAVIALLRAALAMPEAELALARIEIAQAVGGG